MGWLSGGSSCSQVGHVYYLNMAYAFCGECDEVMAFTRAGTIEWQVILTLTVASTAALSVGNYLKGATSDARCKITGISGTTVTSDHYLGKFIESEVLEEFTESTCEDATGDSTTLTTIDIDEGVTVSGNQFTAQTGVTPDPKPDDYPTSLESCPITCYFGDQVAPNALMAASTGYNISYTGVTYLVLGDR